MTIANIYLNFHINSGSTNNNANACHCDIVLSLWNRISNVWFIYLDNLEMVGNILTKLSNHSDQSAWIKIQCHPQTNEYEQKWNGLKICCHMWSEEFCNLASIPHIECKIIYGSKERAIRWHSFCLAWMASKKKKNTNVYSQWTPFNFKWSQFLSMGILLPWNHAVSHDLPVIIYRLHYSRLQWATFTQMFLAFFVRVYACACVWSMKIEIYAVFD